MRFDAVRLFPVRLHQVYGEVYNELHTNIKREIAAVSANLCLKIAKFGFSVWTSAGVPVVVMQKKSSFIHNGIERIFTAIKNFIDIQKRLCFI